MRRFQNTCVVVTRGRRLVRTWAGGLDYADMICRLDGAIDLLTNRSRIWSATFSPFMSLYFVSGKIGAGKSYRGMVNIRDEILTAII